MARQLIMTARLPLVQVDKRVSMSKGARGKWPSITCTLVYVWERVCNVQCRDYMQAGKTDSGIHCESFWSLLYQALHKDIYITIYLTHTFVKFLFILKGMQGGNKGVKRKRDRVSPSILWFTIKNPTVWRKQEVRIQFQSPYQHMGYRDSGAGTFTCCLPSASS